MLNHSAAVRELPTSRPLPLRTLYPMPLPRSALLEVPVYVELPAISVTGAQVLISLRRSSC